MNQYYVLKMVSFKRNTHKTKLDADQAMKISGPEAGRNHILYSSCRATVPCGLIQNITTLEMRMDCTELIPSFPLGILLPLQPSQAEDCLFP